MCLDTLAQNNQGGQPGLYPCHKMGNNQVSRYFIASNTFRLEEVSIFGINVNN